MSIQYYYVCDCCGKKLETKIQQTPFGEIEVICGLGKPKELSSMGIFQHLCKECALSLDNAILKAKMELLSSININRNNKKCGTCFYAKPTIWGSKISSTYVECTNKEHLMRYCKHQISKKRQRTTPACKSYKEVG